MIHEKVKRAVKKAMAPLAMAGLILISGSGASSTAIAGQDRDWRGDRRPSREERQRFRREERDELYRIREMDREHRLRYRTNNRVRSVGYFDRSGNYHQYGYYDRWGYFHRY